ncbi:NUDIX domain-containing protein [Streptomyces longisporoflavus]|uniref:NUDIX domain-containing protein n=1 Tax=Streptomyces longisporoflavus TaxID=28044 RepID=UPI00167D451C|nr:NUDIX domain-containing protein [Streptomyces longisporoflavus]
MAVAASELLSVGSAIVCGMDEVVDRVDAQDRVLGPVSRRDAIREGWLHRVAVVVCHDRQGRILVHRRAGQVPRFPGYYEVGVGGAVGAGETYEQAAVRELDEELGVSAAVRFRFKFLNRSGLSPHWLWVCDAVVPQAVVPDSNEVAWHGWLSESDLPRVLRERAFTPDSPEILDRYFAGRAGCGGRAGRAGGAPVQ